MKNIFLFWQTRQGQPPSCGCPGLWVQPEAAEGGTRAFRTSRMRPPSSGTHSPSKGLAAAAKNGFKLEITRKRHNSFPGRRSMPLIKLDYPSPFFEEYIGYLMLEYGTKMEKGNSLYRLDAQVSFFSFVSLPTDKVSQPSHVRRGPKV